MNSNPAEFVSGPKPVHPLFKELTGQSFARLTVIEYAGRLGHDHAWRCRCECGTEIVTRGYLVSTGVTRSCGCLLADKNRERLKTHGLGGTPVWRIWAGMKNRCLNPNVRSYTRYGGAGVKVCDRWLHGEEGRTGFECFFADMGQRPSPGHSLDRIDPFGDYEPRNVRWATKSQQAQNIRKVQRIEWKGERRTPREWEGFTGIAHTEISKRLKRGWSIDRALTQPMRAAR